MRKILDRLFTGAVLVCLVSIAFLSFYLRPWNRMKSNRRRASAAENPFAGIPLPASADSVSPKKAEEEIA